MSTNYMTLKVLSHAQRVKQLYKKGLRAVHSLYPTPHIRRYQAVLLRARFDENKDIKDPRLAKKILEEGEEELFQEDHYQPFFYPYSPGGVAFERDNPIPDGYLDMLHPLERAQYPEYFKRREQRKLEYIERWEKKYGKLGDPPPFHN